MKNKIYRALEAHYTNIIATKEVELAVYLNNPAGIGEHSDLMEEIIKKWDEICSAKDCLERLEKESTLFDEK